MIIIVLLLVIMFDVIYCILLFDDVMTHPFYGLFHISLFRMTLLYQNLVLQIYHHFALILVLILILVLLLVMQL